MCYMSRKSCSNCPMRLASTPRSSAPITAPLTALDSAPGGDLVHLISKHVSSSWSLMRSLMDRVPANDGDDNEEEEEGAGEGATVNLRSRASS
eukprot:CAMPEP_0173237258 /NCGR_PEP_ID=MMETSP1142-20121109/11945_1 /TAXON_ID=483371 /ORGANISM="non described non described, Strain CCMP2298" /LENGTH=92 /DNA_ID=CAMNT_0014167917 /DNA_START=118 /DNA_END=396 /DNA_ORIENTATION=+